MLMFFFFQAEDGIRDVAVTGVQTCAFRSHVLHYQAKDLMIDRDGLYERGIMSMGMGWQIPRIPGLGDVDWGVVHGELYRQGYEGDCIIEHEDRRFEGSDEKVKQGFLIARDVLRPLCH